MRGQKGLSKRKAKTVWVPKAWLDWIGKYYNDNKMELNKLGVKSEKDLVWRLADFGKPELENLIANMKAHRKFSPAPEKSE